MSIQWATLELRKASNLRREVDEACKQFNEAVENGDGAQRFTHRVEDRVQTLGVGVVFGEHPRFHLGDVLIDQLDHTAWRLWARGSRSHRLPSTLARPAGHGGVLE